MAKEENSFELVENREAMELVPEWEPELWWFFAGGAGLALLILLLVKLLRKKGGEDTGKVEREAYQKASGILRTMEAGEGRDVAVEISIVLRSYLAESLGDSALFETHEEFVARHNALAGFPDDVRSEVAGYFALLAEHKYGQVKLGSEVSGDLIKGGERLLERMHRV